MELYLLLFLFLSGISNYCKKYVLIYHSGLNQIIFSFTKTIKP